MENLNQMTDDMLVSLYSNGNNKAFDTLLSRYQDKLYSYINFVVRNRDLANDIFQETFVKAIVTLQKGCYSSAGKFGAWLTRIAHNLIIDWYRQQNGSNTVSNDAQEYDLLNDASLSEANVEDSMINEQTLSDVRRLVDQLPDNQREVVFMRYYQDLSFKEIADITGVSINTALGRMRYALLNIRKMAAEKDIALAMI
ncbi:MAG: sigma-70 family RNA polymerase sigma factor [Bacteroidaceae bacterium]|nr:sigma-70 family RNA polymerase sigma factor [Candidatus Colenecus caballi]MCQ2072895.1 sigma-70 family RNA polymerase sigma factor [Bacteroidaceae bacterium]